MLADLIFENFFLLLILLLLLFLDHSLPQISKELINMLFPFLMLLFNNFFSQHGISVFYQRGKDPGYQPVLVFSLRLLLIHILDAGVLLSPGFLPLPFHSLPRARPGSNNSAFPRIFLAFGDFQGQHPQPLRKDLHSIESLKLMLPLLLAKYCGHADEKPVQFEIFQLFLRLLHLLMRFLFLLLQGFSHSLLILLQL